MSHITEGLLHAHLDGALGTDRAEEWLLAEAHLGVCEDCRRRLDEARQLRDTAGALLASASSPVSDRPSFDRLVSLAGTGRVATPRRQRWWSSTSRLAWAASLMLAVGAGWLGRELLIQTGQQVSAIVATKQEAAPAPELLDRLAADDEFVGQMENEALPETDAVRGALGERQGAVVAEGEAQADEPRAADAPEAFDLMKSQAEGIPAQVDQDRQNRQDREAGRDRDELEQFADNAAKVGDEAVARRAAAPQLAEQVVAEECYAMLAPSGQAAREDAADAALDRKIAGAADVVAPDRLRLAPDGTATASLDGRILSGTWASGAGDSVTVALSNPEGGVELRLARVESGLSGSMSTIPLRANKIAAKAAVQGREEVEARADAELEAIGGKADENADVSIELTASVCEE